MNIKLSNRMKQIADMVTPGRVTADIGCDHGLVSVYLIQKNIAPRVIAMDIASGPLEAAKKNIALLSEGNESQIELRLSNGFEALKPGETDAAVIAGMGGKLIISILEKGLHNSVINPGYELVLSPQSDITCVRQFLREQSFLIVDEDMLIDEGKFYNIIKAVYSLDRNTEVLSADNLSDMTDEEQKMYDAFGQILIEKKSPVLKVYLEQELTKKEKLFCTLSKQDTDAAGNRLAQLNGEVRLIGDTLNRFS